MEFEAEVMRRIDTLQTKKDLERLKKMQGSAKKDVVPEKPPKKTAKSKAAKVGSYTLTRSIDR